MHVRSEIEFAIISEESMHTWQPTYTFHTHACIFHTILYCMRSLLKLSTSYKFFGSIKVAKISLENY